MAILTIHGPDYDEQHLRAAHAIGANGQSMLQIEGPPVGGMDEHGIVLVAYPDAVTQYAWAIANAAQPLLITFDELLVNHGTLIAEADEPDTIVERIRRELFAFRAVLIAAKRLPRDQE